MVGAHWVYVSEEGGCNVDDCSTRQERVLLVSGMSFQLRLCVYHAVELRFALGEATKQENRGLDARR